MLLPLLSISGNRSLFHSDPVHLVYPSVYKKGEQRVIVSAHHDIHQANLQESDQPCAAIDKFINPTLRRITDDTKSCMSS